MVTVTGRPLRGVMPDDLPEQDLSLRVTLVFRRSADSEWRLVHRHADPLVHGIELGRLAGLLRGD